MSVNQLFNIKHTPNPSQEGTVFIHYSLVTIHRITALPHNRITLSSILYTYKNSTRMKRIGLIYTDLISGRPIIRIPGKMNLKICNLRI